MPSIRYRGNIVECKKGERLRSVLLKNGLSPHNGFANYFNCRGMGTCGTCAVKIEGEVEKLNKREKWRLNFPPHKPDTGLRLACQVRVFHDLKVLKGHGFWGQNI